MKRILLPISLVMLSGCYDDTSDLQRFMADVQATTKSSVQPIPEIKEFEHFAYSATELRSPFVAPKPEAIRETLQQVSNCLHPDPTRRKQPLEKFALDNLRMAGVMGGDVQMWGLVQATDSTLHRIGVGDYLGLFHGKVTQVTESYIELLELIPDGAGCWKERTTKLQMSDPDAAAS